LIATCVLVEFRGRSAATSRQAVVLAEWLLSRFPMSATENDDRLRRVKLTKAGGNDFAKPFL
jgi:hypothetical protein